MDNICFQCFNEVRNIILYHCYFTNIIILSHNTNNVKFQPCEHKPSLHAATSWIPHLQQATVAYCPAADGITYLFLPCTQPSWRGKEIFMDI